MAGVAYPSFVVPHGYDTNVNLLDRFKQGYDFGGGIADATDARKTLAAYAESLYGQQPQVASPSLADLSAPPPGASSPAVDQMIGAEHAAATAATDPTLASYFQKLAQSESGGNPNAQNPNSSAGGTYQITDPTWQALVAQNPNSGLTLDGKMDPQQQQVAVRLLTAQNAKALSSAGQPINPGTLYAAHFLGAPTATSVLGYADNTPMTAAVPPEVLQANPQLQDMTVGDFKNWALQQGGNGRGGYQPPMVPQQPQGASQSLPPGGNGMPPLEVLKSLLQNPETRAVGLQLLQRRTDPTYALDIAGKEADLNLKNAQAKAWAGGLKTGGYVTNPDGTISAVTGGQADPNNPLNYNKTGGGMGAAGGASVGTTGSPTIDPTADGYTSKVVVGGLTQAAIDQRALSAITSGTPPPAGRSGVAGAQAAAISNRMAEIDPSGNLAANKTQLKSLSSTLTQQTQYLNNTERAFNTANDTLAALQTYMAKNNINPSQFPDFNSFSNFLKAHGQDPGAAGGYNAQLQTLRSEYSQVLAKGGARSVETDRAASALIPDGLSPAQLAQVAAQIKIDSDNAINEARNQVSGITEQINGIAVGRPAASAVPQDNSAPPTVGAIMDGYRFKGGDPSDQSNWEPAQ